MLHRDSVTSVGLTGRTRPLTSHNAVVKTFRQALALDERRARFRHNPGSRTATNNWRPHSRTPPKVNPKQNTERVGPILEIPDGEGNDLVALIKRAARRRQQVDPIWLWEAPDDYSIPTSSSTPPVATEVTEESSNNQPGGHSCETPTKLPEPPFPPAERSSSLLQKPSRPTSPIVAFREKPRPLERRKSPDDDRHGIHCHCLGPGRRAITCAECEYDWQVTDLREVWFAGAHSGMLIPTT